jgi:hypothetical protein
MRWRENPHFKGTPEGARQQREQWDRWLWLWRLALVAALIWLLADENWDGAAVFVALWLVAEVIRRRRRAG